MEQKRLPGLDGIRAISIGLVLAFHVTESAGWNSFRAGSFGVEIFFVLSGFLITWLLCCEDNRYGSISLRTFYARRALRILPPALAYLATLEFLAQFALVSSAGVLPCLAFIRNLVGGDPSTAHFWSLSVEEQFYLLWPFVFALLGNNRRRLNFAAILILIAPIWTFTYFHFITAPFANDGVPDHSLLVPPWARFDLRYQEILIGCSLALLRNDQRFNSYLKSGFLQSSWLPAVAVTGVAGSLRFGHSDSLAYLCVAVFINYALEHTSGWGYALNLKPIVWIGKLSYSLYIWQQLFCWTPALGWLGRFPQNIIATFVVASLSYYLIEQPFATIRKRVRFVRKTHVEIEPALVYAAGTSTVRGD